MKTRILHPLFLIALMLVAGGKMYGQQIVYEPYDFRQVNADGDTLYYRITSDTEPYTVAVTRCHDSTYHQLPVPQYFYQVGQPGFAYPVYDYDSLINIPSAVTHDEVTYTVTAIDIEAFYYQKGMNVVNLPSTIETIDTAAFYLSSLTEITLQEGLQRINSSAFTSTGIRGVYLPQSVSHIGIGVFANCKQLQNIAIPSNITKISWGSFMRCDSLNHVELPEGVDTIEAYAFYATHSLRGITIPSQVRYIGASAFNAAYVGDKLFLSIKCQVPPTLEYHSMADYDSLTFEVPCGTLEAYQNTWLPDLDLYVANSVTFIEDCNAVEEYADSEIRVYPNPTSDVIYIEGMADGNKDLYVYDMLSNVVVAKTSSNNDVVLNISDLSRGFYVIKIVDEMGTVRVAKVCKE